MSNESTKMFMNVIRERHDQYKSALTGLLDALSNNDQAKKLEANHRLLKVSQELASVLAQDDRPPWLTQTITVTNGYARKNKNPQSIASGSSWALLQKLMNIYQHAMGHAWKLNDRRDSLAYDFDAVFEKSRQSRKFTELFDSMIETLEKILGTGEIDSVNAINALNRLIGTLSQNKKGSYFSTVASWQFVRSFTKNYLWETLGTIPGVQPIKTAFEKTLRDLDIEMDRMHEEITSELRERFDMIPNNALTSSKDNPLLLGDDSRDEK